MRFIKNKMSQKRFLQLRVNETTFYFVVMFYDFREIKIKKSAPSRRQLCFLLKRSYSFQSQ